MLTIHEKFSRHWSTAAVISGILVLVLGLLWLNSEEILLKGYLRLATFCFFALTLLIALKLRQGQTLMDLRIDKPNASLNLIYRFKGEQVDQQTFDLRNMTQVDVVEMPNRSLYNDFSTSDVTIRIRERDDDHGYYLFSLNDRVIPLDSETAGRVVEFLNHHR